MLRIRSSLPVVLTLTFVSSAIAQPGFGPGRGIFPAVGSVLPDVTVYDEDGKEFSTKALRGHYSVLVFGCLT